MALAACGASWGGATRFFPWLRLPFRRWVARPSSGGPPSPQEPEPEPVVRIPRAWQLRLERGSFGRKGRGAPAAHLPRTGKLLLRSRRPELSQAARHTVGRWEQPPLVSAGWKHRLSRGDYFQLQRLRKEPPQVQDVDAAAVSSFQALGVQPQLASILEDVLSISKPTGVQIRAIPPLLTRCNVLCAAETGSGKTLAYLLPLIQQLLESPVLTYGIASIPAPRSLVVLPSRELAGQVRRVASYLCNPLDLQVREIGGGRGEYSVWQKLRAGPTDLLVATPGALYKALRRKGLSLEKLCCLVLDEVDTLLDPTFVGLVEDVLRHACFATNPKQVGDVWDPKAQLVAVGATLPKGLGDLLSKVTDLSSFNVITSFNLHCLQPHVEQKFVRLKGTDKVVELLQLLKDRGPSSGAVLIFCNKASTVNWLGYILDDHKIKHLRLQGQMQAPVRAGIFTTFQKGQFDILVCTDIASRGLDTTHVELVVNYDFPPTLHDYLHRVGRIGRTGSKFPGTAISFVTHKWDVDLVRKIETSARKRTPLPGMEPVVKEALSKKKKT